MSGYPAIFSQNMIKGMQSYLIDASDLAVSDGSLHVHSQVQLR